MDAHLDKPDWLLGIPDTAGLPACKGFDLGPLGVFIAIPVAETELLRHCMAKILFKRGKWKLV